MNAVLLSRVTFNGLVHFVEGSAGSWEGRVVAIPCYRDAIKVPAFATYVDDTHAVDCLACLAWGDP